MSRPLAGTVASAVVVVVAVGGCGGDDGDDSLRPIVGDIAPAVDALEEALGGPQQYFEINATPQLVNLFVAVDGGEDVDAYIYVDGELGPPKASGQADAATFAADDLDFDPDAVLDQVGDELADSDIVVFSAIEGGGGSMEYLAVVQSASGGVLDVTVSPDGETLSVDPRTEPEPGPTVTTS